MLWYFNVIKSMLWYFNVTKSMLWYFNDVKSMVQTTLADRNRNTTVAASVGS